MMTGGQIRICRSWTLQSRPMSVVITSYSLLTPFGDADQTFAALLEGRFLEDTGRIDCIDSAGGLDESAFPRVTTLALQAGRRALEALTPLPDHLPTALIFATSKGE